MYIGPWQEFKLAKILQIKDKIEKEEQEANKLEQRTNDQKGSPQRPGKAYSTGARLNSLNQGNDNDQVYVTTSNMRANSRQNTKRQQAASEYQYKFKLAPEYAPPPKQIPVLRGNLSDSRTQKQNLLQTGTIQSQTNLVNPIKGQSGQYTSYTQQNSLNSKGGMNNQFPQNTGKHSPTTSNYSYALSNGHSTQYTQGGQNIQKPGQAQSLNSKGSYLSTRQSASNKASLSEYRAQLRNRDKSQNNQLPIEIHYEQWNRFENFLKFASKKEIKDRLKELDPPPLENYIDPDVIDKIRAASKPPNVPRKSIQKPGEKQISAKEENRLRIEKMKQLYGLYKQFQEEENKEQMNQIQNQEQTLDPTQKQNLVSQNSQPALQQQMNSQNETKKNNFILPEVQGTPSRTNDDILLKKQLQQPQPPIKLPELPKNRLDQLQQPMPNLQQNNPQQFKQQQLIQQTSYLQQQQQISQQYTANNQQQQQLQQQQQQKPSLYSFYQKIIDRSNPAQLEKDEKLKHPNYQVNLNNTQQKQQTQAETLQVPSKTVQNKFQSQGRNGQLQEDQDDIREDLSEEADKVNSNDVLNSSIRKKADGSIVDPNDKSIRKSFEESEIDGLIKWAKDLPDDIANQSSTSFFKKGFI